MGSGEDSKLTVRKAIALAGIALWILTLAFVSGPARWEFSHSYGHWVEGAVESLPSLTRSVALPVLGLGETSVRALVVTVGFWSCLWLGALALICLVWTARSREQLLERLALGAALYGPLVVFLLGFLAIALWLPFALL